MNKNIVITGSTRGIGLHMAHEFLKAGCNVTLSGRKNELPQASQDLIKNFTEQVFYVPCNVQDKSALQTLWDLSVKKWGSIDIWINNAGRNTPNCFAWETDDTDTLDIIATNISGMVFGSQVAAAGMLAQGHGAIYSMEGLGSNNMIQPKTILYGTTKRALTYFMQGLAKELKDTGIIAGRLSPGMMLTDFITKTPDGAPSDVVESAHFKKVFNILADKPEPVAAFLVKKMRVNTKNNRRIAWLPNAKVMVRFMTAPFNKRKLL